MTGELAPHQKKEMAPCITVILIIVWQVNYSFSARFNLLYNSTNQQLFGKHLSNQSSHYKNYRLFLLGKDAYQINLSKDEWGTKEDTGKSMKNVLYV